MSDSDIFSMVERAVAFAREAHRGQFRRDGKTPYIAHPLRVKRLLEEHGIKDMEVLSAAVLHDVLEDTSVTVGQLVDEFGETVAELVEDVTNVYTKEKFPHLNRRERKVYECGRIGGLSPKAKLIKIVDRLDNVTDGPIKDYYWHETEYLLDQLGEPVMPRVLKGPYMLLLAKLMLEVYGRSMVEV